MSINIKIRDFERKKSDLSPLERKHMEMMKYAYPFLRGISNKERVITDLIRQHMFTAWDLMEAQRWTKNRLPILNEIDGHIKSLLRLIRAASDLQILQGQNVYWIWAEILVQEGKIVGKMITTQK